MPALKLWISDLQIVSVTETDEHGGFVVGFLIVAA
jgi:hypothetical protein